MNTPPELALLRLDSQRFAVGYGPFEERTQPPLDAKAFYINDFFLTHPKPWRVPARVEFLQTAPAWTTQLSSPTVAWECPDPGPFAKVFADLQTAFSAEDAPLQKLVPTTVETGRVLTGDPRAFAARMLTQPGPPLWSYGFWKGNQGFCGATPEILLRVTDDRLESMALAGTALPAEEAAFQEDPKQLREHLLVVQGLMEILGPLGVSQTAREVMTLDGLSHLHTRLSGPRPESVDLNTLIAAIHPTPAVGVYPRTTASLQQLRRIRDYLDTPPTFGAPFGFWDEGRFHSIVAIRQICWENTALSLPSGCGIIRESQFEMEWEELALKRQVAKRLLGC